jgi:hypothetical protein
MTNLTVRKSHRPPKPVRTPPVTPKTRPKAVEKTRRVGKPVSARNKPPTTNRVEDEGDDVSDEETYAKPVKDVSNETYTLQKLVMLSGDSIIADTDFIKLGEFGYRQFEQQTIRKLDNAVKDTEVSFELVSGTAVVSAKGVTVGNSLQIMIEDCSCWQKVEKAVERWMLENRKQINVKLTILYKKVGGIDSESSEDEGPTKKKVHAFVCY